MSSFRLRQVIKEFVVKRLAYSWSRRKSLVSSVVKKCRGDGGFHEVIQCFRFAFFRPSRTFFLSVTAAYHNTDDDEPSEPCTTNISDEDLKALITDFEVLEELSHKTLYCTGCLKRVQFDKKQQKNGCCSCKEAKPVAEAHNGWMPFMEAEDVIIWRKKYKGDGMYAYKVYGHYKDVKAEDFAAVQVDGAYRKAWDDAVAALSVVERCANGVPDQSVIHWEVLWPRLFANRDYVYVRRHMEFDVKTRSNLPTHSIMDLQQADEKPIIERENVHTKAKLKSMAMEKEAVMNKKDMDNKMYVIVSKSCEDPRVPETNNAVRVKEYWSHMVIRTINGPQELGTEFVLTYYDEPAVGGMPTAIASFAAARGAPAFLAKMRRAAKQYAQWRRTHGHEEQDFMPFGPERLSHSHGDDRSSEPFSEQGMESSKRGIDIQWENQSSKYDKQTQTESPLGNGDSTAEELKDKPNGISEDNYFSRNPILLIKNENNMSCNQRNNNGIKQKSTPEVSRTITETPEGLEATEKDADRSRNEGERDSDKPEEDEETKSIWYKYLYPFYYFV